MLAKRKVRRRQAAAVNDALPADLHPVIRRVLLARGIGDEESLDLKLARLQAPGGLSGVNEAAELLARTGDLDAARLTGALCQQGRRRQRLRRVGGRGRGHGGGGG